MSTQLTPEPRMTHQDTATSLFAYCGYNNMSTVSEMFIKGTELP